LNRVGETETRLEIFEKNLSDIDLIGDPIRNVGKIGRSAPYKCNTTRILENPENFFRPPSVLPPGTALTFALQRSDTCSTKGLK
jgi:hypothetical protein